MPAGGGAASTTVAPRFPQGVGRGGDRGRGGVVGVVDEHGDPEAAHRRSASVRGESAAAGGETAAARGGGVRVGHRCPGRPVAPPVLDDPEHQRDVGHAAREDADLRARVAHRADPAEVVDHAVHRHAARGGLQRSQSAEMGRQPD